MVTVVCVQNGDSVHDGGGSGVYDDDRSLWWRGSGPLWGQDGSEVIHGGGNGYGSNDSRQISP